jgi:hypothetical protein
MKLKIIQKALKNCQKVNACIFIIWLHQQVLEILEENKNFKKLDIQELKNTNFRSF